ncbi:MAG: hypothetical protein EPN21_16260 [Methylococcaceae bacterium]|nr:MAG: hypothetical protein EPN21_16260 [Methylococcaceae bacterium]
MGGTDLIYQEKLKQTLTEAAVHLLRIDEAFEELAKKYSFPIAQESFLLLLKNRVDLAFADQVIYRFSKAQDTIGAKLFKAFMLYQGENVDKPFRDILNALEKLNILDVEEWFVLREIRNEIAHDYENNQDKARNIVNSIYQSRDELKSILSDVNAKAGGLINLTPVTAG